jgi:hypothetical protein
MGGGVMFKPTKAQLEIEARNLEEHAQSCLKAWVILGRTEEYEKTMEQARKLRHAMTIKGVRARREFLGWKS